MKSIKTGILCAVAAVLTVLGCSGMPSEPWVDRFARYGNVAQGTAAVGDVRYSARVQGAGGGVDGLSVVVTIENAGQDPVAIELGAPPLTVVAFSASPGPDEIPIWDELAGLAYPDVGMHVTIAPNDRRELVHQVRPPQTARDRTALPPASARLAIRLRFFSGEDLLLAVPR